MHLVSPSLPVGGFTYSQGLEWAVEGGWVDSDESLSMWLNELINGSLSRVDIPVLARLYDACERRDELAVARWNKVLLAYRETAELRMEERNRGRALATLLANLEIERAGAWLETISMTQASGFALAASSWQIPLRQAALGYAWSWLENLTLTAVKIIPLGQTAGQQVMHRMSSGLCTAIDHGFSLNDDELGASHPAAVLASCLHETQYTRLFRS